MANWLQRKFYGTYPSQEAQNTLAASIAKNSAGAADYIIKFIRRYEGTESLDTILSIICSASISLDARINLLRDIALGDERTVKPVLNILESTIDQLEKIQGQNFSDSEICSDIRRALFVIGGKYPGATPRAMDLLMRIESEAALNHIYDLVWHRQANPEQRKEFALHAIECFGQVQRYKDTAACLSSACYHDSILHLIRYNDGIKEKVCDVLERVGTVKAFFLLIQVRGGGIYLLEDLVNKIKNMDSDTAENLRVACRDFAQRLTVEKDLIRMLDGESENRIRDFADVMTACDEVQLTREGSLSEYFQGFVGFYREHQELVKASEAAFANNLSVAQQTHKSLFASPTAGSEEGADTPALEEPA